MLRHNTGGSGRGPRQSGQAGWGKIGCQRNYSPRKQITIVPFKKTKKCHFNVSPEAQTSEILCVPTQEQNHQLTRREVDRPFFCVDLCMQGMSGKTALSEQQKL